MSRENMRSAAVLEQIKAGLPDRSVQIWIIGTAPLSLRAELTWAAPQAVRPSAERRPALPADMHSWYRLRDLLAAVQ